jgi:CubicO group peptidase (beta-lactamase class C family)
VQALEGAARQATTTSTAPGLAVALVHHGQLVWAAGYGVADRMTGQPVTAATRFQAASLSKPVTAWGVLRLVEAGPDRPGRAGPWPPATLASPTVAVRCRWHHCPSAAQPHRRSVGAWLCRPDLRAAAAIDRGLAGGGDGRRLPGGAAGGAGAALAVLGGGYSLLQLLDEEVSGRPFADYVQAEVLEPLA